MEQVKYYVVAESEIVYVSENEEEAYSYAMEHYSNGDFEVCDTEPAGVPYKKPDEQAKKQTAPVKKENYKSNEITRGDLAFAGVCTLIGVIIRIFFNFEAAFYIFLLAVLVTVNWIIKSIYILQEQIKKSKQKDQ